MKNDNAKLKIIFPAILLLGLLCFAKITYAANHCVRPQQDCTYSGDGSTWACAAGAGQVGAFRGIPATAMVRGDTYYLGSGNYDSGRVTLNTAVSGESYIYIKKATASAHGPDTGWNSSYGTGQAIFTSGVITSGVQSTLQIETSYWEIDGVTGGYPNWTSGHGIKITTTNPACNLVWITFKGSSSNPTADHIHIYHTELAHMGAAYNSQAYGMYGMLVVYGAVAGPGYHHFAYNYIHDSTTSFVWTQNLYNSIFEYNYFDTTATQHGALTSTSARGSPIVSNNTQSLVFRFNIIRNGLASGYGISLYGARQDNLINDIKIYGNLFYFTPDFAAKSGAGCTGYHTPLSTECTGDGTPYECCTDVRVGCGTCCSGDGTGMCDNTVVTAIIGGEECLPGYLCAGPQTPRACCTGVNTGNCCPNETQTNILIYNNTFVNQRGFHLLYIPSGHTGNVAKNNIFYGCQGVSGNDMTGFDHSYNWFYDNRDYRNNVLFDSNLASFENNTAQIGTGSPFIDLIGEIFGLAAPTNSGDNTLGSPYNIDMLGRTRGTDGVWDRGVYEYVSATPPSDTTPPSPPSGVTVN